jgi:hypothetical protein
LFNALILWGIVQSNMDGFTAMLLAVLFVRAELQDWTERLNRWAKAEMLATIQGIMAKHGMPSPLMNPKHDTGLKFEADPPQSQR